eukprot:8567052-Alexandrium_andersonii.AAC.1
MTARRRADATATCPSHRKTQKALLSSTAQRRATWPMAWRGRHMIASSSQTLEASGPNAG